MKKVLLMPLEAKSYNYGGLLQQYALQCVCNGLGCDTQIINDKFLDRKSVFSVKTDIRNFTFEWFYRKISDKFAGRNFKFSESQKIIAQKRRNNFDLFREQYMSLTEPCTQDQLKILAKKADAVVCGSDQIWNPAMTSYPLFLDFVDNKNKKIIYAASISRESLSKREKTVFKELIKDIGYISVRENKGKEIIDEISENVCKVVLDPTMLIDESFWYKKTEKRIESEKYVFCYFLGNNLEVRKKAEVFAKTKGLKLLSIPLLKKENVIVDGQYDYIDRMDASPIDFLNYIRNAEYVIADSFHVVVFSLLFKKKFFVVGRKMAGEIANSRLETLLGYFSMENHLDSFENLDNIIDEEIDYNKVFNKLYTLRRESMKFLKNALNS